MVWIKGLLEWLMMWCGERFSGGVVMSERRGAVVHTGCGMVVWELEAVVRRTSFSGR